MPIRYLTPVDPNQPPVTKPVFGKNALSILVMVAVIFLIVIVGGAFALAKSGLVTVPVFSERFYTGPQPIRKVQSAPIDATAFRVLVSSRLLAQTAERKPPPYVITLSETELTGALKGVIDQAFRDQGWTVNASQVAVMPTYLEFTGLFVRGPVHLDVRVRFMPVLEQGGVRFLMKDIRLGDYPLHPKAAERLAGLVFARDLGTWALSLGDVHLESVILQSGALQLVTSVKTP